MKIEVFGPGCTKCRKSAEVAAAFLVDRGIDGEVVKQQEIAVMVERGVLMTPTTVIDGEIAVEGRMLRERDLEEWLKAHGQDQA